MLDDVRQGMDDHFAKIQPALFKSVKRVLEGSVLPIALYLLQHHALTHFPI